MFNSASWTSQLTSFCPVCTLHLVLDNESMYILFYLDKTSQTRLQFGLLLELGLMAPSDEHKLWAERYGVL